MSTYVREKVLRIPLDKLNMDNINNILAQKYEDYEDDYSFYLEETFPDIFEYAKENKFQIAPTLEGFIDYVVEYESYADGHYGRTRALTDNEKRKYRSKFQQIDPDVDMDYVRLVEFCWYNVTEAPDYYDDTDDPFYDEV